MDLTQGTLEQKNIRAKKMLLLFAMVSMFMMFAGLTSAYLVSNSRPDWVKDFQIPTAFFVSTAVIIASSITFFMSKKALINNNRGLASGFLIATLILGISFIFLQYEGFSQIVAKGYYFTGNGSTINSSFMYAIVFAHILHVIAGLIVLLVVIYNHFKEKYKPGQTLGFELGAMFWHFLDGLWVYLIVFFYFAT
ncbi:heme-copper oxidase subunit III [Zhouia sp. PK063]|uniref:heme-copper oxidase subunit III n=1 Tax=Zhouia sp. PK063 TaxID=3373602 RepID=UPI0037AE89C8